MSQEYELRNKYLQESLETIRQELNQAHLAVDMGDVAARYVEISRDPKIFPPRFYTVATIYGKTQDDIMWRWERDKLREFMGNAKSQIEVGGKVQVVRKWRTIGGKVHQFFEDWQAADGDAQAQERVRNDFLLHVMRQVKRVAEDALAEQQEIAVGAAVLFNAPQEVLDAVKARSEEEIYYALLDLVGLTALAQRLRYQLPAPEVYASPEWDGNDSARDGSDEGNEDSESEK